MKVIIKIKSINNTIIKYSNVVKVYRQDLHINVDLKENYEVSDEDKKKIREHNVSTTPFLHTFYDAEIVAVYE